LDRREIIASRIIPGAKLLNYAWHELGASVTVLSAPPSVSQADTLAIVIALDPGRCSDRTQPIGHPRQSAGQCSGHSAVVGLAQTRILGGPPAGQPILSGLVRIILAPAPLRRLVRLDLLGSADRVRRVEGEGLPALGPGIGEVGDIADQDLRPGADNTSCRANDPQRMKKIVNGYFRADSTPLPEHTQDLIIADMLEGKRRTIFSEIPTLERGLAQRNAEIIHLGAMALPGVRQFSR
jgi:hypothetical protein